MDTLFDITEYRPTRPPVPGDTDIPEGHHLDAQLSQLRIQTNAILRHPYDPTNWAQRAETLSNLWYPELAVGDTHKAALLCRSHIGALEASKGTTWRLGYGMGFAMSNPFPPDEDGFSHGQSDSHEHLLQHLSRLQCRVNEIESRNLYHYPVSDTYKGQMLRRMYPWMEERHRRRDDQLLTRLNREFASNSGNVDSQPFCVVKRDAFGDRSRDVLGVFAARDINDQELILIDQTTIWGTHQPQKKNGDIQVLRKKNAIHGASKLTEAEIDLSWIRDEVDHQACHALLTCRLLLSTIWDGIDHPLSHDLIARLTPTYSENGVFDFDPLTDIALPNQALQRFGIDIFADLKYDTWVLFTIQQRISNNSCDLLGGESLNPLFALFNHSCDPNVDWSSAAGNHRTIMVRARRNIRKGEQLLVEYDQFMRDQRLHIRRERYYRWLDAPCQCTRCRAEEVQVWDSEPIDSNWNNEPDVVFPEELLKN